MSEVFSLSGPAELAMQFINTTDRPVFLTGKAGTGKTTFLKSIVELTHKKTVVAAPTGIAAINAGGVTLHALFQLPFGMFLPDQPGQAMPPDIPYSTPKTLLQHANLNTTKRRIIAEMELLVIDEVSMLRADLLDAIDWILRYVRRNSYRFGGVQILFIGDLHQLPPVVKNNEWRILHSFYNSMYFFDAMALQNQSLVCIELDKIYRQTDNRFIEVLNNLRNNIITQADINFLKPYYRENFQPSVSEKYITLTTHNQKAESINQNFLEALHPSSFFYDASVRKEFPESAYPCEKRLELKVGAQVMFTKNDQSGAHRFFNGKIATVTSLGRNFIEVLLNEETVQVEPFVWENIRYETDPVNNELKQEVIGTFTQFPLRLAWAITVHKSQGLTFDKAIIDIGSAFAPGQIYVALSRLRSVYGLVLASEVTGNGIKVDQNITKFNQSLPELKSLRERITQDSHVFLEKYVQESFDFSELDKRMFELAQDKPGQGKKIYSEKDIHRYLDLSKSMQEATKHGGRFIHELKHLFKDNNKEQLLERMLAAEQYFIPFLTQISDSIFARIEVEKANKISAKHFKEWIQTESVVFECQKKIRKSVLMVKAIYQGLPITKLNCQVRLHSEEREKKLKMALGVDGSSTWAGAEKKIVAEKPKEDTKSKTFRLFQQGKSVGEIANERNLRIETVESHLVYFIARKELDASKLISKRKLKLISQAIADGGFTKLWDLKLKLGSDFTFSEIKIGMAHHFAAE